MPATVASVAAVAPLSGWGFFPEVESRNALVWKMFHSGKTQSHGRGLETTMASGPTDRERLSEAPTSELLRSLLADIRLMLQREAELAKLEVKDRGSRLGIAGGILAGAAVVALLALGTLIAAAVLGLAIVLPPWAAALVVGTVLVVAAVVMFLVGRARMHAVGSLVPTATIETAREDVAWIRREGKRLRSTA